MEFVYLVGPDYQCDDGIQVFSSPKKAVEYYNEQAKRYGENVIYSLSESGTEIISSNQEEHCGYYIREEIIIN
jgi:hypothetical protein